MKVSIKPNRGCLVTLAFCDVLALKQLIAAEQLLTRVIINLAEGEGFTLIAPTILFPTLALVGFNQALVMDSPSLEQDRAKLLEIILVLLFKVELIGRVVF